MMMNRPILSYLIVVLFILNSGRTASVGGLGPQGDHVVNPGAYRFSTSSHERVNHLIQTKYDLDIRQYGNDNLHTITDANGIQIGFDTFVKRMAQQSAAAGVQFYYNTYVYSIQQSFVNGSKTLTLKVKDVDDTETTCTAVIAEELILNLAMRPTLNLLRESTLPQIPDMEDRWRNLLSCSTNYAVKLYLC